MLLIRTYVAPSSIEGVGVFAGEAISRGTVIWRFDPAFDRLVSKRELDSAPPHIRELYHRYCYPYPYDRSLLIYETDNGRFMNHADNPNTDFSTADAGWVLRDVAAGDELTCNYLEFGAELGLLPPASQAVT